MRYVYVNTLTGAEFSSNCEITAPGLIRLGADAPKEPEPAVVEPEPQAEEKPKPKAKAPAKPKAAAKTSAKKTVKKGAKK